MAEGNDVNLNVSGLTPNSEWILYATGGTQLTQQHPVNSSGAGVLSNYDITLHSPLYWAMSNDLQIYAKDSAGVTTPVINA